MTNKYYLDTNTTTTVDGKTLYQIVANHNITTLGGAVVAGTAGGYIQYEGVCISLLALSANASNIIGAIKKFLHP